MFLVTAIKPIASHFKAVYTNENRYSGSSTTRSEDFINLLYVVNTKNPSYYTEEESHSRMTLQQGGNIERVKDEEYFPNVTTSEDLSKMVRCLKDDSCNIMILEGAPGIGKSMVAKEIACRWASSELLKNINLLLLIVFRDPKLHDVTDVKSLIQYCYPESEVIVSHFSEHITNETQGKNVMIIFDGYDELPGIANVRGFFMKILKREVLPKCKILFTSRPYITANLHQYCQCRVEVMGLTEHARHAHLKENLSDDEFTYVMSTLKDNLVIDSLCYIPLNLAVIIEMAKRKSKIPKTQTELTKYSICCTITHDINKGNLSANTSVVSLEDEGIRNTISCLATFAYNMIEKEFLVFSEEHMQQTGLSINENHNAFGLLQSVELLGDYTSNISYSFVHFSVQEYLAAYHLSTIYALKQISELEKKFWIGKYFGTWKMYTGITKGEQFALQKFLSDKKFIPSAVRHVLRRQTYDVAEKFQFNKVDSLQLYQILLEAPDSKLKNSISKVVKDDRIDLSGEKLSTREINIVSYFIVRSYVTMNWQIIDLSDCGINDEVLESFCQTLCLKDGRKKPTICHLNVSNNGIHCLKTLHDIIKSDKVIELIASGIVSKPAKQFIPAGSVSNKTMELLDLSSNGLSSDDVLHLCKTLVSYKMIRKLCLANNCFDDKTTSTLVTSVIQWDNLQNLDCCNNHLSPSTTELLQFAVELRNNTSIFIDLAGNINHIEYLRYVMECMNGLLPEHCKFVSTILKLQNLSLDCQPEKIHPTKDCKMTVMKFKFFPNFQCLEKLNLSGISFSREAEDCLVVAIHNCVHSLKFLTLNSCKLTSTIAMKFVSALENSKEIKELQLRNNMIGDEATETLVKAILDWDSLETINLEQNSFSENSQQLFDMLLKEKHNDQIVFTNDRNNIKSLILMSHSACMNGNKSSKRFIMNVSTLTCLKLDITQKELLHEELKRSVYLDNFTNLLILDLSGIVIDDEAGDALVIAFATTCNLQCIQCLTLNNCCITSHVVIKLASELQKRKDLRKVELCNNLIDDSAKKALAVALFHWNLLDENGLLLQGNDINLKFFQYVFNILKFSDSSFYCDGLDDVKHFIELLGYIHNISPAISQFVDNVSKVKRLSVVVPHHVESKDIVELEFQASHFFERFVHLEYLNVSGVVISEQASDVLDSTFADNLKSLKHLSMIGCNITSKILIKWLRNLQMIEEFTELQLNDNFIDDEATESLALAILNWGWLETFEIEGNVNFSHGSRLLLKMITKFSHLQSTDLTCANFNSFYGSKSFIAVLDYVGNYFDKCKHFISNISKIEELQLSALPLSHSKCTMYASLVFHSFLILTNLRIFNVILDEDAASNIIKALSKLTHLKQLVLNNCNITNKTAALLAQELQEDKGICDFDLSNNVIGDETVRLLTIAFLHWDLLESLHMKNNKLNMNSELLFDLLSKDHLEISASTINFSNNVFNVQSFFSALTYANSINNQTSKRFISNISKIQYLFLNLIPHPAMGCTITLTIRLHFFHKFQNLVSLNFSGVIITEQASTSLFEAIATSLKTLLYLDMRNCGIHSEMAINLVKALWYTNSIKRIAWSNNYITDEATEVLATAILHWDSLESICLTNNNFNKDSELLFDLLMQPQQEILSKISFSENYLSNKSLITVLDYANTFTGKASLYFRHKISEITDFKIQNLMDNEYNDNLYVPTSAIIFLSKFTKLIHLNLSGIVINEEGNDILARAFSRNLRRLKCLMLNDCHISTATAIKFVKQLQHSTDIKELQLCHNRIDDNATQTLTTAILHWRSFVSIKIEGNSFSENSVLLFKLLTMEFDSLISIKLCDDICNIKSFVSILEHSSSLPKNKATNHFVSNAVRITELSLCCSVNEQFILSSNVCKTISTFCSLTKLNIKGFNIREGVPLLLTPFLCTSINLNESFVSAKHASLNVIALPHCQLTSYCIKILLPIQRRSSYSGINELDLSFNNIDDSAADSLISSFLQMPKLNKLNVKGNNFNQYDINTVFEIIKSFRLKRLSINYIIDDEVVAFFTLLKSVSNTSLHSLSELLNIKQVNQVVLQCNSPRSLSMEAASSFLHLKVLAELNMVGILIQLQTYKDLANTIGENHATLRSLTLKCCGISDDFIATLSASINKTGLPNLALFDISHNNITDEGMSVLVEIFVQTPNLHSLITDNNQLQYHDPNETFNVLKHFRNFESSVNLNRYSNKAFFTLLAFMNENTSLHQSIQFENVTRLRKLTMYSSPCKSSLNEGASSFLKYFILLNTLSVTGISIESNSFKNIVNALTNNLTNLQVLVLNNCKLDDQFIKLLQSNIKPNTLAELTELDLSWNCITDYVIEPLVAVLLKINKLKTLHIDHNDFRFHDINGIFKIISCFKAVHYLVNFEYHKVSAFFTVLTCMNNNVCLQESCQFNNIERIKQLNLHSSDYISLHEKASLSFKYFVNLKVLNMTGVAIEPKALKNFVDALTNDLTDLKELVLNNCKLDDNFIKLLQSGNTENTFIKLTKLDLSWNSITDYVIEPLVEILHVCKLETLFIVHNSFKVHDLNKIFKIIKFFKAANYSVKYKESSGYDDVSAFFTILTCLNNNVCLQQSYQFNNIKRMKELVLDSSIGSLKLHVVVSTLFQYFIDLEKLSLSGISIESTALQPFVNALTNNLINLKVLILKKCSLDDNFLKKLQSVNKGTTLSKLTTLDLSDNNITDNSFMLIIEFLLPMTRLTSLCWNGNCFRKYNVNEIFRTIIDFRSAKVSVMGSTQNLEHLVSSFFILITCMKKTVHLQALASNYFKHLKHVTLECFSYYLNDEESSSFQHFTCLETLSITGISIVSTTALKNFIDALTNSLNNLQVLVLKNCALDDKFFKLLQSQNNGMILTKLEELDLSHNNFTDNSFVLIVELLLPMTQLSSLSLNGNKFISYMISEIWTAIVCIRNANNSMIITKQLGSRHSVPVFLTVLAYINRIGYLHTSKQFKNIGHLRHITLECSTYLSLSDEASSFFQHFTQLQRLNLTGLFIKFQALVNFVDALTNNLTDLQELMLKNCGLNDMFFKLLSINKGTTLTKLTTLDLSENYITDKHIVPVIELFLAMTQLTSLNVNSYCIKEIFKTIKGFRSEEVSVTFYRWSVPSFLALITSMQKLVRQQAYISNYFKSLKQITLYCLPYSNEGDPYSLSDKESSAFQYLTNLENLTITGISINPTALKSFVNVLANNLTNLQVLMLKQCSLDDNFFILLQSGKEKATLTKLTTLDLSDNNITDKCFVPITEHLLAMTQLTLLNFSRNRFKQYNINGIFRTIVHIRSEKISVNLNTQSNLGLLVPSFFTLITCMTKIVHMQKYALNCFKNLKHITLQWSPYCLNDEESLLFQHFYCLETLNITGISIVSTTALENFIDALINSLANLKVLVLKRCSLDDKFFKLLQSVNKGTTLSKLTTLDLSDNNITDSSFEPIVELLLPMTQLNSPSFIGNSFIHYEITKIWRAIVDIRNVNHSVISTNLCGSRHFVPVFLTVLAYINKIVYLRTSKQFKSIASLQQITLECSPSVSLIDKASSFFQYFTHLEKLDLTGISIESKALENFIEALTNTLTNLQVLVLKKCKLDDSFFKLLQSGNKGKTLTKLTKLDLSNNIITNDSFVPIIELLLPMTQLTSLIIQGTYCINEILKTIMDLKRDKVSVTFYTPLVPCFLTLITCMQKIVHLHTCTSSYFKCLKQITLFWSTIERSPYCLNDEEASSFQYFTNLENLTITGISIKLTTLTSFVNALSSNLTNLLTLVLRKCELDDSFFKLLQSVNKGTTLTKLTSLDLSDNNITDESFEPIIELLLPMTQLTSTNFYGNYFTAHKISEISTAIVAIRYANNSVKFTKWHTSYGSQQFVPVFFTILSCINKIDYLRSSKQFINIESLRQITLECSSYVSLNDEASSFFQYFTHLEKLDLTGISIESKALEKFVEALTNNLTNLQVLILNNCKLGDNFFKLLQSHNKGTTLTKLKTLHISDNNITDESLLPIVELLLLMTQLTSLNICEKNFKKCDGSKILSYTKQIKNVSSNVNFGIENGTEHVVPIFLTVLACIRKDMYLHTLRFNEFQNLNQITLTNSSCVSLSEEASCFFQCFTHLKILKLTGVSIKLQALDNLVDALTTNLAGLQKLTLKHCKLDDRFIKLLHSGDKGNTLKNLTALDLSYNHITDEVITPLFVSLLHMTKLVNINVDGNEISESNIPVALQHYQQLCKHKKIGEYLRSPLLVFPNHNSFITLRERYDIAGCFTMFRIMKQLILGESPLHINCESITKIESVQLISSTQHEDSLLKLPYDSASFLKELTCLQEINITGIHIYSEAVNVITDALQHKLRKLEALTLSNCGLHSKSIKQIFLSMKCNILKYLDLSHNEINSSVAPCIKYFLDNNPIIRVINFSHDKLESEAVILITEELATCRNLEWINLSNNQITDGAANELLKMETQLKSLRGKITAIDVSGNPLGSLRKCVVM